MTATPATALLTAAPVEKPPKLEFKGHEDVISSFVFLQDNVHIVSACDDGTIRMWNCETGRLVVETETGGYYHGVFVLALSPDGKTIACGRRNGGVERWETNSGQMMEGIWTGHSDSVQSLSWSPDGCQIASGSYDGTILVREAESGQIEVRIPKTGLNYVESVAYSPVGDKIASSGDDFTIYIWGSRTGRLLVTPIKDFGFWRPSVVWSSDGSELYSVSDKLARVFDATSGTELHHFQHDSRLVSIALSPKYNLLACVGVNGVTRLWDTVSHQLLGYTFHQEDCKYFRHVSFSPDGRYLAYGGDDNKLTLWMVEDSTPPVGTIQGDVQQDTLPQPTLSCSLDVDAVSNPFGAHDIAEEARDDPYNDFFASSQSLPLQSLPRRIAWYHSLSSLIHLPAKGSIRSYNWHIFSRRTSSNPPSHVHPNGEPVWNVKSSVGNEEEERNKVNHSANSASSAAERQEEPITLIQPSSLINPTSFAEPDSDQGHTVRKLFTRARRKDDSAALTKTTHDSSPEVAEVHAARGFKRYVAYKPKSKKKSPILTISPPPTAADGSGLSQAGIPSHSDALHVHTSPQEPLKPGSQSIFASGHTGQSPQANYTSDDSNSDLSIQGPWNKFLNRICFPCGHFYGDDP